MKKPSTPGLPRPTHYNTKDIPSHTENDDGTVTYTFDKRQKTLLFKALSHYGNIIGTSDKKDHGFTPREVRIIRALREGF